MKQYQENKKGFTLIELLVVVAIIGLLSSVVLASLNSARAKAKDAAIKAAMTQVANLMALNYNEYGSYCQISPPVWVTASGYTCDALYNAGIGVNPLSVVNWGYYFTGIYAQKARDLCNNIYNNATKNGGYDMLIYIQGSSLSCANSYSWTALLNNGKWFCSGSSGAKGEYSSYGSGAGCYQTP